MKKKKLTQKERRRRTIMMLVYITLICIICLFSCGSKADKEIADYDTYIVSKGDTLWGIADRYYDDSVDIRIPIRHIREKNNISDAKIYSGDVILLPVYAD